MTNLAPRKKGKSPLTNDDLKILQQLGLTISELRKKTKGEDGYMLSQEKLAEYADMHRTFIGSVERGERNMSFLNFYKICEALDIKPSQFLKKAGL